MKMIKSPEDILYSLLDEDVHFKKGTYAEELVLTAMKVYAKQFQNSDWIKYDWNKIESKPEKYGKYFVHRKDGKVHWETWNSSGWAYNNDVITHYKEIKPPTNE